MTQLRAVHTIETIDEDGVRVSNAPGKVFEIEDEDVADSLLLAGAAVPIATPKKVEKPKSETKAETKAVEPKAAEPKAEAKSDGKA